MALVYIPGIGSVDTDNAVPSAPPSSSSTQTLGSPPPVQTGPTAQEIAASNAAAAESKAKKAGKDQTSKENAATQSIIDTLLASLGGYSTGRDALLKNSDQTFEETLRGILDNYGSAVQDYAVTGESNKQDQASKSAANVTNRARERTALLGQILSQGGGETDALRAIVQAAQNFDANQLGVDRAFFDTERQIGSQIAGANSQAETQRRSAWQQLQEARGQAYNDYYKNYMDVWTNIQRTAAGNTNVDSDYSTGFKANFGGKDAEKEAAKYAGKTYVKENKDDKWYQDFEGRRQGEKTDLSSTNRAGATTITTPKRAEGATLRKKW